MAKQKIIVKLSINSDKKSRKALKIAVSISGVESVSFIGSDRDQIAVTGEGIDSIELTRLLRKGVGHTDLLSVGPVEEKKVEEKKAEAAKETKPKVEQLQFNPYQYYYYNYDMPYYYSYQN